MVIERDSKGRFIKNHKVPKTWREAVSKVDKHGENHPNWKGGKESYLRKQAKKVLGIKNLKSRKLLIHHKDGDIRNYSKINLEIMKLSNHSKFHYLNGDYPEMDRFGKR